MNRDVCEHFNPLDLDCSQCGRKTTSMNYEYDQEEFTTKIEGILGDCIVGFSGDPGELFIDYIKTPEGTVIQFEVLHPDIVKQLEYQAEVQVSELGDDISSSLESSYIDDGADEYYEKQRQDRIDYYHVL